MPTGILEEVKEVSKAVTRRKKRGVYSFFSPEQKTKVAKYATMHGVCAAVSHFSKEFSKDLKENTMRDWVKAYAKEFPKKCSVTKVRKELDVAELPTKKQGRPCKKGCPIVIICCRKSRN